MVLLLVLFLFLVSLNFCFARHRFLSPTGFLLIQPFIPLFTLPVHSIQTRNHCFNRPPDKHH
ncbi:hypothetical protein LZ32DRAFT_611091 [Colletotrichum eremochloae]|nr:hypothetical protein LZ32DRAFT_611091 [Colletotrichum eremochloae]